MLVFMPEVPRCWLLVPLWLARAVTLLVLDGAGPHPR